MESFLCHSACLAWRPAHDEGLVNRRRGRGRESPEVPGQSSLHQLSERTVGGKETNQQAEGCSCSLSSATTSLSRKRPSPICFHSASSHSSFGTHSEVTGWLNHPENVRSSGGELASVNLLITENWIPPRPGLWGPGWLYVKAQGGMKSELTGEGLPNLPSEKNNSGGVAKMVEQEALKSTSSHGPNKITTE